MVEPDRTLLILNEIRGELRRVNTRLDSIDRRLDLEFSEDPRPVATARTSASMDSPYPSKTRDTPT